MSNCDTQNKDVLIIPTRNRQELLLDLLDNISFSINPPHKIIVVDSSDNPVSSHFSDFSKFEIIYIHTKLKSAAVQRNIGLDYISDICDLVFFLDDDVRINLDYFELLRETLKDPSFIGASGLAVNLRVANQRKKPRGIRGLFYRLFLLDSRIEGKLLRSGVNIPVRLKKSKIIPVDWLIGCSTYKFVAVGLTRFEKDFQGASLAEDVIFSLRMKQKGLLVVNTNVVLDHIESNISRISNSEFWKMWVINRLRVIKVAEFGTLGVLAIVWSTLGQLVILIYSKFRREHIQKARLKAYLVVFLSS